MNKMTKKIKYFNNNISIVSLTLILAILVNTIVVFYLIKQRKTDIESYKTRAESLSESLAMAAEMYFERYILLADTIGDDILLGGRSKVHIEILLRAHKYRSPAVHEIVVLDRLGDIAYWTAHGEKPYVRDRPYYAHHARAHDPKRLAISEPLPSRLYDDHWFMSISRRRVDAAGEFAGSIAILVDLRLTAEYFSSLLPHDDFEIQIIHDSGLVIGTLPFDPSQIGRPSDPAPSTDRDGSVVMATVGLPGMPIRVETRLNMADATARWNRLAAASGLLLLAMNGVVGFLVRQLRRRDIERAAANRALMEAKNVAQRATAAKSSFLAAMSHEIRTPMSAILGMIEILRHTPLSEDQTRIVNVIEQSSSSLLQIINDILDFSKIEAGHLDLNPVPTSLADLVEGVAAIYEGLASSKGLTLDWNADTAMSAAHLVDPLRLRQILNNFASNAIKFTEAGQVKISASLAEKTAETETIRFRVSDTGIGIPADVLPTLFRPFVQGEATTTARFGGTGLGLSICRRLSDRMGGRIDVESEVGSGTTFILTLPLRPTDERPDSATARIGTTIERVRRRPTPSVAEAAEDGTLVLIAEDHPVNRAMLLRQLDMIGYAAEAAHNGLEALEMWRRGRYAVLITDLNMPKMGGVELARRIREDRSSSGADAPILALTANVDGDDRVDEDDGVIDEYLTKPINLGTLSKILEKWRPLSEQPARPIPKDTPSPTPIDRGALVELSNGDLEVEREILREFQETSAEDMEKLGQFIDTADAKGIAEQSHRIKGASRTVGATKLANLMHKMEKSARFEKIEEIKTLWKDACVEIDLISDSIDHERDIHTERKNGE